jgi:hypothetical protein
MKPEMK